MRLRLNWTVCLFILPLLEGSLAAREWATGQAATAVLGQPSFSSHSGEAVPTTLAVSGERLYVSDTLGRVLAYDISTATSGSGPCSVCRTAPVSLEQRVVSADSVRFAKSDGLVAVADPENGHVLLYGAGGGGSALPLELTGGPEFNLQAESVALDGHYLYAGDVRHHRIGIWRLPLTEDRGPDMILGGKTGQVSADSTEAPVALASDGDHLFVADGMNRRVLMFVPGDQQLATDALVSSASGSAGTEAPGSLVTLRGNFVVPAMAAGDGPLPRSLAGVELLVDGRPVPLASVSGTEIRAQLPYNLTYTASASLWCRYSSADGKRVETTAIAAKLAPVAPALFTLPGGKSALAFGPEGPMSESAGAKPGEVITVWATGLGWTVDADADQPVAGEPWGGPDSAVRNALTATVDGQSVDVVSALLPQGSMGVYQVSLRIPEDLPVGRSVTLRLAQNGTASNAVSIPIENNIQN